jgi:hypothetical protein
MLGYIGLNCVWLFRTGQVGLGYFIYDRLGWFRLG